MEKINNRTKFNMNEIKYIYFEIKHITGFDSTDKTIENENVLLFKPKTNSSGIWGRGNITERHGFSKPSFLVVNQYWVDLEKFDKEKHKVYDELKKYVDIVLEKVNQKLLKI